MDWMRRILQGGKPSLQPGEGSLEERQSRLKQTTARGFAAYTFAGSAREGSSAKFADLNDLFKKVGKVTRELYALSTKIQPSYSLPLPLQKTLDELKNPVKATISRKELETLYDKLVVLEEKLEERLELESKKRKTIPPAALLWGDIVAKMDPFHTGMNGKNGRAQTTRRYAGIGPVAGGAGLVECATVTSAVNSAIRQACFTTGRGMVLEVYTGVSKSEGHAHGLYKEGGDLYLFLDPNFGVFRYREERVRAAMEYLWVNGGDSEKGYYPEEESSPSGHYAYTTFAKDS